MYKPDVMIIAAPTHVLGVGQSFQINTPNSVAQTSDEYENGATTEAGAALSARIRHKWPSKPNAPDATSKAHPVVEGGVQCCGKISDVTTAPAEAVYNNDVMALSPRDWRVVI